MSAGLLAVVLLLGMCGAGEGGKPVLFLALDCRGELHLGDPDQTALSMTEARVGQTMKAMGTVMARRLKQKCPDSSPEAIELKASPMKAFVRRLRGQPMLKDPCLQNLTSEGMEDQMDAMVLQMMPCTPDGSCLGGVSLAGIDATLQMGAKVCSDGSPAFALYCSGSDCGLQWATDGTCPPNHQMMPFANEQIANMLPTPFPGNACLDGKHLLQYVQKVVSRFLGKPITGLCLPTGILTLFSADDKSSALQKLVQVVPWNGDVGGRSVSDLLENGVKPLPEAPASGLTLTCDGVVPGWLRMTGLSKLVDAVGEVGEEVWKCMGSPGGVPFMLANGFWQPWMWLNALVDYNGVPPIAFPMGSIGGYIFAAGPLANVPHVAGTETFNRQAWKDNGYVGVSVQCPTGKVSFGVSRCEGTPHGLPAVALKTERRTCAGSDCSPVPSTEDIMKNILDTTNQMKGSDVDGLTEEEFTLLYAETGWTSLAPETACLLSYIGDDASHKKQLQLQPAAREYFGDQLPSPRGRESGANVALVVSLCGIVVGLVTAVGVVLYSRGVQSAKYASADLDDDDAIDLPSDLEDGHNDPVNATEV